MPSHSYAPLKEDKFAFGIWCLQNRGRDPFGDQTRPELSALECIRGLAQRNCYGFEFHDNDIIPFGASAAQRDQILRDLKKALSDWGILATMATTNLFYHPVFKDGAFTSTDPAIRAFATQKVLNAVDIGAEMGARVFVFWGGREGTEVDASKDPVEAGKWFREALNFLCEYVLANDYELQFSIEPKPNEPRGDLYLPTVGSVLAFIATLDHPDMVGINPETAHIKMAGLNPYHEFAQALDAGKLLDVHLNGQKPLRFDQDLSFGSDDLKDAFFTIKLLMDHKYEGTIGFDAHPYRSEADPWDFVDRNLRTAKIMQAKVKQFNENKEIQDLLKEIHGANPTHRGLMSKYGKDQVKKLKEMTFDVNALAARRLPYERLDQLLTEVLLGVLENSDFRSLQDFGSRGVGRNQTMAHQHSPGFLKLVNEARKRVREVTVDQVKARLDKGERFHLIDVREESEWAKDHLPGAIHLGKGVIERDIEERLPDRGAEIVLYCGGGFRSALAADNLQKMGYTHVLSMDGGIRDWREKGYPLTG